MSSTPSTFGRLSALLSPTSLPARRDCLGIMPAICAQDCAQSTSKIEQYMELFGAQNGTLLAAYHAIAVAGDRRPLEDHMPAFLSCHPVRMGMAVICLALSSSVSAWAQS